jgi:hypothetical protein
VAVSGGGEVEGEERGNGTDGEKTRGDEARGLFGYEDNYPSRMRISRIMSKESFANSEIALTEFSFKLGWRISFNKVYKSDMYDVSIFFNNM